MFTGIIEQTGVVKSVSRQAGGLRITVELGSLAQNVKKGDSIAINGACLTVSALNATAGTFDVSGQTVEKTTLAKFKTGTVVNLESAIQPQGRFGGHFVLGHIDGTAAVKAVEKQGEFVRIRFACSEKLLDEMVPQGSVAVDGISLTIADVGREGFAVAAIPVTLEATTLGKAKPGDEVNIETDIIVKTINARIQKIMPSGGVLNVERLREIGF